MAYSVRLQIFEGPLDLLLHLVKKNEVDIYDIQISSITEQYLDYIGMMKEMNLDIAGEFLMMAATLVHLKSKLLLPPSEGPEDHEEDDDGITSREELIRRLIEYKRYKGAAEDISKRLVAGRDVFFRGSQEFLESVGEDAGLLNITVFELMDAFRDILKRAPKERVSVEPERFKIADKINHIMERLKGEKSALFISLFPKDAARAEIIVTFLAILELAKLLLVKIFQTADGAIRLYIPEIANTEQDRGENG
mgnify:CR=1 FL=1